MTRGSRRPERVGETVRMIVADAIQKEIRDPRVGFVTVTRVEVTGDLSVAKVFLSVMGDEAQKQESLQAIAHASGKLRSLVSRRLATKTVPELQFVLDRGLEHAHRIEQILSEIKREDDGES